MEFPSQERLQKLFEYKDGRLVRSKTLSHNAKKGGIAGFINSIGYRVIMVDKVQYLAHRLIWQYVNGEIPDVIDHKDMDRDNNNISNLRNCTHTQNHYNEGLRANNTSGVKGVSWMPKRNKWQVGMYVNGKRKALGYYKDFELAKFVADEAREHYHGEYARAR